jgi:prepilin-type N-terminal cleavage/methylation domain-containing protein
MLQDRKGFTLIELLIVVVIIGILATIAIPRFSSTREKAFLAAMKSDLRNLQTQQSIYWSDNSYTYAGTTAALEMTPSDGVTIAVGTTADGWTATSSHNALAGVTCGVYEGSTAASPAVNPGAVTCNNT